MTNTADGVAAAGLRLRCGQDRPARASVLGWRMLSPAPCTLKTFSAHLATLCTRCDAMSLWSWHFWGPGQAGSRVDISGGPRHEEAPAGAPPSLAGPSPSALEPAHHESCAGVSSLCLVQLQTRWKQTHASPPTTPPPSPCSLLLAMPGCGRQRCGGHGCGGQPLKSFV